MKQIWYKIEKKIPELTEYHWGYASDFVHIKLIDKSILVGRLIGDNLNTLSWNSPYNDQPIENVVKWSKMV